MQLGELKQQPSEHPEQVYPEENEQAVQPGGQGSQPLETRQYSALQTEQIELLGQMSQPIGQARQTPLSSEVALLQTRHVRSCLHWSQLGGQLRQSPDVSDSTVPVLQELQRFSSQQARQPGGHTRHSPKAGLRKEPSGQALRVRERRRDRRMTIQHYNNPNKLYLVSLQFRRTPPFESNCCGVLDGGMRMLRVVFNCMPKVIDKYVLEEVIGKGQFGEVFRGRHQDTLQVVAIKSIRRDMIKGILVLIAGKFYELLQNEIKVLKACDNPHIIKLLALKKTPHNYYLMLEYCDGGDMLAKVREVGALPEQQVLGYLGQILNAFQTLTTHKIMHRDFKLANILLHQGQVKIADFGFAKLLAGEDYTNTMLGSPLNMAPEVLGNSKYNSKADIWSIGACIYEMIYGKPPYVASNMVDLLKLIKAKPLVLPKEPNICPELADVFKRMLVADVKRRIQWSDLFKHPVNTVLSRQRVGRVQLELAEDESLMLNTSKCYLQNNLVLQDPTTIQQNSQVNEYLLDIIRTGKKPPRPQEKNEASPSQLSKQSQLTRSNSKVILHFRNIYAYLASVADQVINREGQQHSQLAAYVLVRKILSMIEWLLEATGGSECKLQRIEHWEIYRDEPEFIEIRDYILKERDVFGVFHDSLQPLIKKQAMQSGYPLQLKQLLTEPLVPTVYVKYLGQFLKEVARNASLRALQESNLFGGKKDWKVLYYGLKAVHPQETFGVYDSDFCFKSFYESFEELQEEPMLLEIEQMLLELPK